MSACRTGVFRFATGWKVCERNIRCRNGSFKVFCHPEEGVARRRDPDACSICVFLAAPKSCNVDSSSASNIVLAYNAEGSEAVNGSNVTLVGRSS